MASIKNFIKKTPTIIQKMYYQVVPFEYRYGKKYYDMLKLINDSKKWSYDQAKNFQFNKLKEILKYCNNNIPYYNKLFKNNGFDINIKSFEDIKNIPFLTKKDIKENFEKLKPVNFNSKFYDMHTSGTTGERLHILGTDDLFKIEAAFITNAYNDHGAQLYKDHSIWIRRYSPKEGDPIAFDDIELNRSYMSAFHLNNETIHDYIKYINEKKSKILVSYPSTIYYLSCLCEKFNLKLKHIKFIHGASEVCLSHWSEKIKNVFGIDIKMHYGQVEKISFFHQDSENDLYKENLLYSYNEIVENDILVGTGFYNTAMPLIRYKTNDILIKNEKYTLNCFPKTIKRIDGRDGDMLITEKDSYVPAVNFYSFMSKIKYVDFFQITQSKKTKAVKFYIVPNNQFNSNSEKELLIEMQNRLGNIQIEIIKTNSIEREKKSQKIKIIKLYDEH
jgi:phenylacetate-CoA ligase